MRTIVLHKGEGIERSIARNLYGVGVRARMNRIRELRRKLGLSSDDLAKLVDTSGATIRRLELGDTQLTVEWMQRLSEALQCAPADLLALTALAEIADEVVPVEGGPNGVAAAIRRKGLEVYKVI